MKKTQEKTLDLRKEIEQCCQEIATNVRDYDRRGIIDYEQDVAFFEGNVNHIVGLFKSHDATLLARIEEMVGKDYWGDCRDGFQAKLIDDIKKLIEGK